MTEGAKAEGGRADEGLKRATPRRRSTLARLIRATLIAVALILTALVIVVLVYKILNPRESFVAEVRTARAVLVRNVRVYDPAAGRAGPPSSVLIENGVVSEVSDDPARQAPHADCTVIDGAGAVLMPSLTDFHVHLGFSNGEPPWASSVLRPPDAEREKECYLYAGVTNVVEGSPQPFPSLSSSGDGPSPNRFQTGRMVVARAGHPLPMIEALVPWPASSYVGGALTIEIEDARAERQRIEDVLGEPATHHLKIVYDNSIPTGSPKLSPDALAEAIRLAHGRGKPAYVHVGSASDAVEAVRAGADVLMHVPFVDTFTPEQVRELAGRKAAFVTTSQIWSWGALGFQKTRELTPLERRLMPRRTREAFEENWEKVLDDFKAPHFDRTYIRERVPAFERNAAENIRLLHAGGVTLLAGTDTGVPGTTPGASLQYELRRMVSLGITARDALRSATEAPARFLTVGGRKIGRVEAGFAAELIIVALDPSEDLSRLESVTHVFTRGKLYRRRD